MCCFDCYASRCLADCFIVSFCCTCRWCCGLPSTYEEDYRWEAYPSEMTKVERTIATRLEERRLPKQNGFSRSFVSRGCQKSYHQKHNGRCQDDEETCRKGELEPRPIHRRRSSGTISTCTKQSMEGGSLLDGNADDPILKRSDEHENDVVLPVDPIQSARSEMESEISV